MSRGDTRLSLRRFRCPRRLEKAGNDGALWQARASMKMIFTLALIVGLGYVAYSAILAAGTYLEVSQIVDDAVLDLKPGLFDNVQQALTGERDDVANKLREGIRTKVSRAQLPIASENIVVNDTAERLQVQVKWTQPVIIYQNEVVLSVPLTVKRGFGSQPVTH
jgi:hypothetical protein